ncbi:MAG: hypothetical protein AAB475_02080 [Patescibacteria group bacterium]
MVEIKRLKRRIEIIEKKNKCSIDFKSAENLIGKISRDYRRGMSRQEFIILVEESAKKLELGFNYCRVAFSYCSNNERENRNKTENLQYRLALKS